MGGGGDNRRQMATCLLYFWFAQRHLEADYHAFGLVFTASTHTTTAPTFNLSIDLAIEKVDQKGQDQKADA